MFGRSFTLFRLLGFRVKADASWLLLALLVAWSLAAGLFPIMLPNQPPRVYWLMGGVGVVGLFLSIVIHEFSHSLVARRFGLVIEGITLFLFGGVAEMEDEPANARAEFLMALAGPASSLALAGAFGAVGQAGAGVFPDTVTTTIAYLAYLNLLLGLFNLVPAFPLDGGRLLRATLWGVGKNLQWATRVAAGIGQGLGLALMALGAVAVLSGNPVNGLWWLLIGMFVRAAAQNSYGQLRLRESVRGFPVRRFMSALPVAVAPEITLRDFYDAYVIRHHHQLYPVVDGGRLVGVVRANAGRRVEQVQWPTRRVAEFAEPATAGNSVDADVDAAHALAQMVKTGNSRLVVTHGEQLAGVLTLRDLAAAARLGE